MYTVQFAENFLASADDYAGLVNDTVQRGCQHIAAHPSRAMSGFTIEVTNETRQLIFEVSFRRMGRSD